VTHLVEHGVVVGVSEDQCRHSFRQILPKALIEVINASAASRMSNNRELLGGTLGFHEVLPDVLAVDAHSPRAINFLLGDGVV